MAERIVVGAGLAGLVAAIRLARKGNRVRVLEKYGNVGGQPERWPAVDVTPMEPEKLSRYLGISIGEPQVKPCRRLNAYLWGEPFEVELKGTTLCCVERGPRDTALDRYLLEVALAEGVKVEFEHPVIGQGALAALPPDTIIATGLYAESFQALGIPYQMGWCYGAKGRSERDAEAAIYFGDYTTDYAYWASSNGVDSILFFQRAPLRLGDLNECAREIEATEGETVDWWMFGYGPTPTAKFNNPRLFASDKILAGTLSGMLEPFVLFGVHGALVSGRIAAMAVDDRNEAYREFKRCLAAWKGMYLNRRVYEVVPPGMRRMMATGLNRFLAALGPDTAGRALRKGFAAVPGFVRVNRLRERDLLALPE